MTGRASEGGTAGAATVAVVPYLVPYVVLYVVLYRKAGTNNPSQPPVDAHLSHRAGRAPLRIPALPIQPYNRPFWERTCFIHYPCIPRIRPGLTGYGSADARHMRVNDRTSDGRTNDARPGCLPAGRRVGVGRAQSLATTG
ncbi:hypothetical protein GCM10010269_44090 [Streptomyces humidus]|uniref:Uncharacterized protein n=1 Tax=Streptomyces humidus TaxID=52259 RepID=A0A918L4Q2_9ACTN|nr:hypothetical protein GCM10010269_44090 [Streptomyces humidus]